MTAPVDGKMNAAEENSRFARGGSLLARIATAKWRGRMGRTTIIVPSASPLAAVFAWVLWPGEKNQAPAGRNGSMQTVSVGVSSARRTDIHAAFYALGAVTPLTTVTVKPQVNGILRRIAAPSGAGDAGRSRHAERLSVHPDPEWLFAHGTAEMFGKITADQKKFR